MIKVRQVIEITVSIESLWRQRFSRYNCIEILVKDREVSVFLGCSSLSSVSDSSENLKTPLILIDQTQASLFLCTPAG